MDRREKNKQQARRANAKQSAEREQKKFDITSITVPSGFQLFRWREEKTYKLDLVPFLAGKENPGADPGLEYFARTIWTHSGIGLDQRSHYICPLKTSTEGKAKRMRPCPICEHFQNLQKQGVAWEGLKPFVPKRRQLLQFIDLQDTGKGAQIFDNPYPDKGPWKGLSNFIADKLEKLDEDSPKINFWTFDEGMELHVSVKNDVANGNKYLKPMDLDLEPRRKQYDKSLMDKGCCLDDLVKELSYDELNEIFAQTGSADEDDKAERNGKQDDADDDDRDNNGPTAEDRGIETGCRVKHKKFGVCEVSHVSKDGTSLKLEDGDGELHSAVAPGDCTLIEDEDEEDDSGDDEPEEKPVKKGKRHVVSNNTDAEDEDDDSDSDDDSDDDEDQDEPEEEDSDEEDSDDDDEPAPRKPAKAAAGKKPPRKEAEDDDDGWDEDDALDEKEDDPPPKKPAAKPVKKAGKR